MDVLVHPGHSYPKSIQSRSTGLEETFLEDVSPLIQEASSVLIDSGEAQIFYLSGVLSVATDTRSAQTVVTWMLLLVLTWSTMLVGVNSHHCNSLGFGNDGR